MSDDPRRHVPAVDALLDDPAFAAVLDARPRERVRDALRDELADLRRRLAAGDGTLPDGPDGYAEGVERRLALLDRPSLRPVVNATGVILHTNLGRAPLAASAVEAMVRAAAYANLEYDLDAGARGSRYVHCVALLRELTGAEDALVVNNCAAALMLALGALAANQGVAVSRGELVEIGGGFRVPEILARSGARLIEVGSTNRTRPSDYRGALSAGAAALLKVHRSNFRITGFTEDTDLHDLVALGREAGVPVVYDLGSGLLDDPEALGLPPEPRARDAVSAGADVVAVSGDKLLGGPQAGILVGRADAVARLRRDPMCRALRVDKVTLAGLEATLRLYRDPPRARREIPVLRMLSAPVEDLEARARALAAAVESFCPCEVLPGEATVGGGTYPGVTIPSWTLRLDVASADAVAARLRAGDPPVVVRIEDDRIVVDLRTVSPEQDDRVRDALRGSTAAAS